MARPRNVSIHPPLAGIVRRAAVQNQAPYSTPSALNVLGSDATVGQGDRDRISTRPGLTSTGASVGTPYNWCEATFLNSGTLYRGVAIAHSGGARVITASAGSVSSFGDHITTDPGTDFATVAVYLQTLFLARYGGSTLYQALTGAAGAGTALGSHPSVAGTPPSGCGLVCSHLDRLWLAGDDTAPHVLYASRIALFYDWDSGADYGGAEAWVSTGAEGGQIGEPITCLVSHTRDCLIVGSLDSMYVVRGNPVTGEVERVSHQIGPLMQSACCHDGTGAFWFVSRDGLYKMPAGCGDFSQSISRENLPVDFVGVDPSVSGTYVSLAYDPRFRCLWLFVDRDGSGSDVFWSFDLQQPGGAWWQHTFSNGPLRLGVTLKGASTASKSAILAANASGTLYQFDRDSSESYDAHCFYGPIQTGSAGLEGMLYAVQATLGTGSDALSWGVCSGGSAEIALAATPVAFTDWAEGLNTWQNPRTRDPFVFIKVYSSGTERWSVENIDARLGPLGLRRAS